jgi:hypothetical protein
MSIGKVAKQPGSSPGRQGLRQFDYAHSICQTKMTQIRRRAYRQPADGGDQRRGGGDRTQESHHWIRLSCLKIVGYLR